MDEFDLGELAPVKSAVPTSLARAVATPPVPTDSAEPTSNDPADPTSNEAADCGTTRRAALRRAALQLAALLTALIVLAAAGGLVQHVRQQHRERIAELTRLSILTDLSPGSLCIYRTGDAGHIDAVCTLLVRNTGSQSVQVRDLRSTELGLSISGPSQPWTLAAGRQQVVNITVGVTCASLGSAFVVAALDLTVEMPDGGLQHIRPALLLQDTALERGVREACSPG